VPILLKKNSPHTEFEKGLTTFNQTRGGGIARWEYGEELNV
jgi:hypothetical protein